MRLSAQNRNNSEKLVAALKAANLDVYMTRIDNEYEILPLPDVVLDEAAVEAVFSAHTDDPTPEQQQRERNRELPRTVRDKLKNEQELTVAEISATLRFLVRRSGVNP